MEIVGWFRGCSSIYLFMCCEERLNIRQSRGANLVQNIEWSEWWEYLKGLLNMKNCTLVWLSARFTNILVAGSTVPYVLYMYLFIWILGQDCSMMSNLNKLVFPISIIPLCDWWLVLGHLFSLVWAIVDKSGSNLTIVVAQTITDCFIWLTWTMKAQYRWVLFVFLFYLQI